MTDLPHYPTMTRDERRAFILPLWSERGLSAAQITSLMAGATRNAVIGVVHRAGMKRAILPKAAPNPPKKKVKQVSIRLPVSPRLVTHVAISQRAPMDLVNDCRPPLPDTVPVSILELPSRAGVMCRYPVIGGYCGQPSGEDMYCKTHHGYVYSRVHE